MSDQPGRENLDNEYGSYSLDDEDQLQPEDTLDGTEDPLDRGYQTADRLQGTTAWGTTPEEERTEETIEQRIRQEVPDPTSAYGAPHHESGLDEDRVGGDDPDAIPADRDFLGSEGERVGRLVAPGGEEGEDVEKDEVARESKPTGEDSPEESAMHYVRDPEDDLGD